LGGYGKESQSPEGGGTVSAIWGGKEGKITSSHYLKKKKEKKLCSFDQRIGKGKGGRIQQLYSREKQKFFTFSERRGDGSIH